MDPRIFELHLAQVERAISNSKSNHYSDSQKDEYYKQLIEIFNKVAACNYESLPSSELELNKRTLDIVFQGIEFLDNSTLTLIPYEIVFCLESVLKDWVDDFDKYVIVTSLNNKVNNYSFQSLPDNLLRVVKTHIKDKFNIDFENILIQINLPKYQVHDYLANVVLYHELGHFIDNKYKITERVVDNHTAIKEQVANPTKKAEYINHFREFFADLFAAQYTGDAAQLYLSYIANNHNASFSHPPTSDRVALIKAFLASEEHPILSHIQRATKEITSRELAIHFKKIGREEFDQLVPHDIKDDAELHSLFIVGWEMWQDKESSHRRIFNGSHTCYRVINNLIEKSISNYMVMTKWRSLDVSFEE